MKIITKDIIESYDICLGQIQELELETKLETGTRYYICHGAYPEKDTYEPEKKVAYANYSRQHYINYNSDNQRTLVVGWVEFNSVKQASYNSYIHTIADYGLLVEPVELKEKPLHAITEIEDIPTGKCIKHKAVQPIIKEDEVVLYMGKLFKEQDLCYTGDYWNNINFSITKESFKDNLEKLINISKVRFIAPDREYLCYMKPLGEAYDTIDPEESFVIEYDDIYDVIVRYRVEPDQIETED